MSALLLSAAMVLACGLTATPDGVPAPKGEVAMLRAPLPDGLAASLASGSPPPAKMTFVGEPQPDPEWIIGMKSDPAKGVQVSRLSRDVFGYKVRVGWARQGADGTYTFTPTSNGSCQIKDGAAAAPGIAQ